MDRYAEGASSSAPATVSSPTFAASFDAVRGAIEVQSGLVERNACLPPHRRIEFRIGIHLEDVVERATATLWGDASIWLRLEGAILADIVL